MRASDPGSSVDPDPPAVLLEIVSGNPTAEELAAVMVVLSARSHSGATADRPPVPSGWTDRTAGLRTALRPGPGAWRQSARHR